jgi:poly(A) polymerase
VPEILMAMPHVAERLTIVSPERIHDELQKLVVTERPSEGFWILMRGALLSEILPELTDLSGVEAVDGVGHKDNFAHSLQVLDNLARTTANRPVEEVRYLRWTALLHDIGKARTKKFIDGTGWAFYGHEEVGARMIPKIFRRLSFPLDHRLEFIQKLIRLHHRPHALVDSEVTDSAVRRLLFDAGQDADDLMVLVRADLTSKNPRRIQKYLRGFDRVEEKMREVEARDQIRTFQPPVDGHEIMQVLGVKEGLAVGILKDQIKEAILDGEIPNEHDAAFAFMMAHKDEALRRGHLFERLRTLLTPAERRSLGVLKDALVVEPLAEDPALDLEWLQALRTRILTPMESHSYQPEEEPSPTPSNTH